MTYVIPLVAIVLGNSLYVVNEPEQVIITQFGKPKGEPVTTPGLRLKMPFIQKANYFEKRFLEWDGDPNQIPTKDKRFIHVDTYARWQIDDVLLFRERNIDEAGAQSRLDDILDGETRNTVANYDLIEVVRSTNRRIGTRNNRRSTTNRTTTRTSRTTTRPGDWRAAATSSWLAHPRLPNACG